MHIRGDESYSIHVTDLQPHVTACCCGHSGAPRSCNPVRPWSTNRIVAAVLPCVWLGVGWVGLGLVRLDPTQFLETEPTQKIFLVALRFWGQTQPISMFDLIGKWPSWPALFFSYFSSLLLLIRK